jgi:S-adenosylmethionine:tRNA ribosyltransferase-isomerase
VKLSDFDYRLPEELIAQEPLPSRDASRLVVVPRSGGEIEDARFSDLERYLRPGDLLVFNDTRVIPARLVGAKESGGRCELLLLEPVGAEAGPRWRAMGQASKPLREGARLVFGAREGALGGSLGGSPGGSLGGSLEARVEEAEGEGFFVVRFDRQGAALEAALEREGRVPLPPYIRRDPGAADRDRYQTVFARVPGSAAAPTAGLHFTTQGLNRLAARGVGCAAVTLHVGPGTFLPVRCEDVARHRMHEERYCVPAEAAAAFAACRARGGRVVAVGTTAVRTLESAWNDGGLRIGGGRTRIFIYPGYAFRAVDAMVTNLHLPRSSLLMLVCAFGGRERVLAAYEMAVRRGYRFFSYGDAMLLV